MFWDPEFNATEAVELVLRCISVTAAWKAAFSCAAFSAMRKTPPPLVAVGRCGRRRHTARVIGGAIEDRIGVFRRQPRWLVGVEGQGIVKPLHEIPSDVL